MGQLVRIDPPTEEQRRETIEKRKKTLKLCMNPEEYHNIFESGEDQYMWLDHYRKQRERRRRIEEYGCDPAPGEDPFPEAPV